MTAASERTFLKISLLILVARYPAYGQLKAGSVMYVDFERDEVTIGADSRMTIGETGRHDDTECKVYAFGRYFVFAMTGLAKNWGSDTWDAHVIARRVWKDASDSIADPVQLVPIVADKWSRTMENVYSRPDVIAVVRQRLSEPDGAISNAILAATNADGKLIVQSVNIGFDLPLMHTKGIARVKREINNVVAGTSISGGHDEIIGELLTRSSFRSRELLTSLQQQVSGMSPSERRATIVSKFIEWSILLNPNKDELAFPVDLLQLRSKTGVHWVRIKPNCSLH
jgi:hypothetical protein